MPQGGGGSNFDEDSFMIRYRKDLELYAKKADLEHTRFDFGQWCNKYQKELERKLNRDELANFEQRLIEILSQSFADKVQNDKDHAKIFKKLQKLWGLVNSMEKGGGNNESAMITKHPYGNISCLACDNGVHRRALEHWPEPDGRIARVGGGYARAALMNSA